MAAVMRERMVEGRATSEAQWQPWLSENYQRHWKWTRQLDPSVRLVVVAPHPDDELLACGGLMAMHARAGGRCMVVGVTNGEASHGNSTLQRRQALVHDRAMERVNGLNRLGAVNAGVVRLGLADGRVHQHRALLVGMLEALLRHDDLVVSTWRRDGHPDHDVVGACAAHVCHDLGCTLVEAPVWMWHWAEPADIRVPWHRLHRLALEPGVQSRKLAALAAHASQLAPRSPELGPVLDAAILARAGRESEYFFL